MIKALRENGLPVLYIFAVLMTAWLAMTVREGTGNFADEGGMTYESAVIKKPRHSGAALNLHGLALRGYRTCSVLTAILPVR
jgi:hypothetical protein